MEIMVLSILGPEVRCDYSLEPYQEGLITTVNSCCLHHRLKSVIICCCCRWCSSVCFWVLGCGESLWTNLAERQFVSCSSSLL